MIKTRKDESEVAVSKKERSLESRKAERTKDSSIVGRI
jgi:hypothetical protein